MSDPFGYFDENSWHEMKYSPHALLYYLVLVFMLILNLKPELVRPSRSD